MNLQRLPLDVIRPILSLLDLTSLVRLNATLNKFLQRTLSSAGVLSHLRLTNTPYESTGHLRYLLKTLHNVDRLTFGKDTQWSLRTLSTLQTLNPLEVTLNSGSIHSSVEALMHRGTQDPENYPELVNLVKNLSSSLLPSFALLTPRLTTLHITCDIFSISSVNDSNPGFSFPPTLTSFCLDDCYADSEAVIALHHSGVPNTSLQGTDVALLQTLPSTLRSLTLRFSDFLFIPLNTIFSRFTTLERLELSGTFRVLEPTFERLASLQETFAPVPATLNALHLTNAVFWIEDLLRWWRFSESNVSVVEITIGEIGPDDTLPENFKAVQERDANLLALLPPTVGQLTLSRGFDYLQLPVFSSLPSQSLTSLTLSLMSRKDEALWLSVVALPQLRSLVLHVSKKCSLTIHRTDDDSSMSDDEKTGANWDLNLDPRSLRTLTHLELSPLVKPLTEDSIAALPSGLKTLIVDDLPLSLIPTFVKYLPACVLHVKRAVRFWDVRDKGVADVIRFPEIWSPVFDVHQWSTAVAQSISMPNVNLQLSFSSEDCKTMTASPTTETLIWTDSSVPPYKVRFPPLKAFHAKFIMMALPNLTKIVIKLQSLRRPINLMKLPPSLTHLELGDTFLSVYSLSTVPETLRYISSTGTFTYLNTTPKHLTYLDAPNWSFTSGQLHLKNMEKLCAKLLVKDIEVIEMLTKTVDSKTRSNMSITLGYFVTGSLIPEVGLQSKLCVTWDMMRQRTKEILQDQLSSPMPSSRPSFGSTRPFGTANAFESKPTTSAAIVTPTSTLESSETIGSVVSSLFEAISLNGVHLRIPKSASEASINTGGLWTLVAPKPTGASLLAVEPSSSRSSIPTLLVRLELINVYAPAPWLPSLASCKQLRFLHISSSSPFIFLIEYLPPRLETMALESLVIPSDRSGGDSVVPKLSFSLSALPATLERLAILSDESFGLCNGDDLLSASPAPHLGHLTQLRHVVISDCDDFISLFRLLPMDTITSVDVANRTEAQEIYNTLPKVSCTPWTGNRPAGEENLAFQSLLQQPLRSQPLKTQLPANASTSVFAFQSDRNGGMDRPLAPATSSFSFASTSSLASAFASTNINPSTQKPTLPTTTAMGDGASNIDQDQTILGGQENDMNQSELANPLQSLAQPNGTSPNTTPAVVGRKRAVKRR